MYNLHGMHPVVCHITAFLWARLHNNYINEQIDTDAPAFVYLVKASLQGHQQVNLQKCDLSHLIVFLIWIHIITTFYHFFRTDPFVKMFSKYIVFKLSLKIKIRYIIWININIILILKLSISIIF
jgi:hypothetical protein